MPRSEDRMSPTPHPLHCLPRQGPSTRCLPVSSHVVQGDSWSSTNTTSWLLIFTPLSPVYTTTLNTAFAGTFVCICPLFKYVSCSCNVSFSHAPHTQLFQLVSALASFIGHLARMRDECSEQMSARNNNKGNVWFHGGLLLIAVAWLSLKLRFIASFIVSTRACFYLSINIPLFTGYRYIILHSQSLHAYC